MTDGDVYIGVDLGTSSLKAVAVGPDGRVAAHARAAYPTHRPSPGTAEQNPADWLAALRDAMITVADAVPSERWRAVGLAGMIPTLVVLDDHHRPVGPAITWQDDRAAHQGDALRLRWGPRRLYERTGQWVDGRYLLPMAAAARARDERVAGDGRRAVGAKDYLFDALTGRLMTDPSTAAGYGIFDLPTGSWIDGAADGWRLPEIADAATIVLAAGSARADAAIPPGLPIVLGAADSVLGADAAGAGGDGVIAYLTGSSTIIIGRLASTAVDAAHRYLVTPTADGAWAAEMDLLATGSAVGWWGRIVGDGHAPPAETEMDAFAPDLPLMLPYLAPGEQGALWDGSLTGAITGLTLAHDRPHLRRALLSGIVVESARCLDVFGSVTPAAARVVAGGPGVSPRLAQDLADAAALPVTVLQDCPTLAGYGAARLAARAVGRAEVPAVPPSWTAIPDPSRREAWAALATRHDDVRNRLYPQP